MPEQAKLYGSSKAALLPRVDGTRDRPAAKWHRVSALCAFSRSMSPREAPHPLLPAFGCSSARSSVRTRARGHLGRHAGARLCRLYRRCRRGDVARRRALAATRAALLPGTSRPAVRIWFGSSPSRYCAAMNADAFCSVSVRSPCVRMTCRGWSAHQISCVRNSAGSRQSDWKTVFVPRSRHFAKRRLKNSLQFDHGVADRRAGKPDEPKVCGPARRFGRERHGVPLALDISGFRDYALRPFLLDRLLVPEAISSAQAEPAEKPEINFRRAKWKARIDRLLGKAGLLKLASSPNEYREPHFHYDPAFEALGSQIALFGYFQSERYFNSIAESLRDWFSPREPLGDAAAAALKRIETSRLPVSVHVRRGDYLKPGTHEVHGILGESFYRQALSPTRAWKKYMTRPRRGDFHILRRSRCGGASCRSFIPGSRLESMSVAIRSVPGKTWRLDGALPAPSGLPTVPSSSVGRVVESFA